MPALVNYSGDDEFGSNGSAFYANPMDSSLLFSIGSQVDVYCPPRKRARISAPFVFNNKLEHEKQPSIEVLPDECLFEIFRRLPGGKERSSCACVSNRWLTLLSSIRGNEIINLEKNIPVTVSSDTQTVNHDEDSESEIDGCLTRSLEGKKATDTRLAAISVGTGSRGGLGKLSIRGCNSIRGVSNLGLSAIARGCPSLRTLSLWDMASIGDEGLIEIAKGCHTLENLDLSRCPSISNKGLIAIAANCPDLSSLSIESCSNVGNESLQAIGKLCSKLKSVSIKDCPLIGDLGVAGLLSSGSSVLTKVKIQALNITDFSLAVIGHYGKNVTNLTLCGLQNVSEKGFWVMGNARLLQKLVSLAITSCRGISDVSLEAIGKGCPNLKQMCLRKCCFISDDGLVAFSKSVDTLESLQLEECNRITQSGVIGALSTCGLKFKSLTLVKCMGIKNMACETSLIPPCTSLRSLSIRNCPWFGSATLASVGRLCPQLMYLDLSGLQGITNKGLLSILESSEAGLVRVNLSGCLNLTDEVVLAMARLHGGTVQLLNLDGCKKITDLSLVSIAENCVVLNDLDVSNCDISDAGIAFLSHNEQLNLQILSLSGCSKVSNKSASSLCKLGKTLLGLNVQHCNSISSSTVELLVEHLWRCDILS